MRTLIQVLEMDTSKADHHWPCDEWRCQRGVACCSLPPARLGVFLGEDYYGNEYAGMGYPFIAVFDDQTMLMVCEDCALELSEQRARADQAERDRECDAAMIRLETE